MVLDILGLKSYIDTTGIKQKSISEKSGVPESALCLILQGKRKCETGEYASICSVLNVPLGKFVKKKLPEKGE